MTGIILMSDPKVAAVPVQECGEPLADIVYTEGYDAGHPTANPETVRDCSLRYDHLRAAALSLRDSAALIRRVMEERYGEQRDTDDDPVA